MTQVSYSLQELRALFIKNKLLTTDNPWLVLELPETSILDKTGKKYRLLNILFTYHDSKIRYNDLSEEKFSDFRCRTVLWEKDLSPFEQFLIIDFDETEKLTFPVNVFISYKNNTTIPRSQTGLGYFYFQDAQTIINIIENESDITKWYENATELKQRNNIADNIIEFLNYYFLDLLASGFQRSNFYTYNGYKKITTTFSSILDDRDDYIHRNFLERCGYDLSVQIHDDESMEITVRDWHTNTTLTIVNDKDQEFHVFYKSQRGAVQIPFNVVISKDVFWQLWGICAFYLETSYCETFMFESIDSTQERKVNLTFRKGQIWVFHDSWKNESWVYFDQKNLAFANPNGVIESCRNRLLQTYDVLSFEKLSKTWLNQFNNCTFETLPKEFTGILKDVNTFLHNYFLTEKYELQKLNSQILATPKANKDTVTIVVSKSELSKLKPDSYLKLNNN